ncbi:MAG: hypothetical protein LW707_00005, partial [Sphingobacteriales bacterium]|nr:hypothetical protein [Sphingobacteriales bacterium]
MNEKSQYKPKILNVNPIKTTSTIKTNMEMKKSNTPSAASATRVIGFKMTNVEAMAAPKKAAKKSAKKATKKAAKKATKKAAKKAAPKKKA